MAKKKRKPHTTRPRASTSGAATGTAERPLSARAERKEIARRERERMRRRRARSRVIRRMAIYTVVALAVAALVLFLTRPKSAASGPLPGVLTGRAPWPANTAKVADRLDRLGLPAAGGAMHIHADLQIFVHGTPEAVPADVGLASGVESPLHTHDSTGVVHIESATTRTFTLGEFFDVWGVRLTGSCIGGYCNDGKNALRAYVNGTTVSGNPRSIRFEDHDVIVLTFGTPSEEPSPIPSTFDWSKANL
jgi:hypothetical protein